MESIEESTLKLDSDFEKTVEDMKPHIFSLPLKSDRQNSALWIQKMCEPPSGITGRKLRLKYSKAMLNMLKKGVLQSPFDGQPVDGNLKPLPFYLSVYFDEPFGQSKNERLPDWVNRELPEFTTPPYSMLGKSLSSFEHNVARTSECPLQYGGESLHSGMGTLYKQPRNSLAVGCNFKSVADRAEPITGILSPSVACTGLLCDHENYSALSDSLHRPLGDDCKEMERPVNCSQPPIRSSASLSCAAKNGFFDVTNASNSVQKEAAQRLQLIEVKFYEERLHIQQKHDAAVQKILDRKNAEIEDVKGHCRSKANEMEEMKENLEKNVEILRKEVNMVRGTKDKEISDFKKLAELKSDSLIHDFTMKMKSMESEFEREKMELQKRHSDDIQEIVTDTDIRLDHMQMQYNEQANQTSNVIKGLEQRVLQLTDNVDRTVTRCRTLEKEKGELCDQVDVTMVTFVEQQQKTGYLEDEIKRQVEASERELRAQRDRTEAIIECLKMEHKTSALKATGSISDLEQQVDRLKKAMTISEQQRQREMRAKEELLQKEKLDLEMSHERKEKEIKERHEQSERDLLGKLTCADQLLVDKEAELHIVQDLAREEAVHAERVLNQFRQQTEKDLNVLQQRMKQERERAETVLRQCRLEQEKEKKQLSRQAELDRSRHSHDLSELRRTFDSEKAELISQMQSQKALSSDELFKEMFRLKEHHGKEIMALQVRCNDQQMKEAKDKSTLEGQINVLRGELVQANHLRKEQLVELGLLREEENQKMKREHETEILRYRKAFEQQRLDMQKEHSMEKDALMEKMSTHLRSIQKEYMRKEMLSSETISEQNSETENMRTKLKKVQENADSHVSDICSQAHKENLHIQKQYSDSICMVKHELDLQRRKTFSMLQRIEEMETDHDEKVMHLKLQHEENLRGMLSADVKQELESTISALQSQVSTLEQRAVLLQELTFQHNPQNTSDVQVASPHPP